MTALASDAGRAKGGIVPILLCVVPFSQIPLDAYTPGLPQMVVDLSADPASMQNTVTAYMLGMSLALVPVGIASDTLGRRNVLLAGLSVLIAMSIACALATSASLLLALRFLQGVGGCTCLVVAYAVAADCFRGRELTAISGLLGAAWGLAPVLAPAAGGFIVDLTSWRGVFIVIAIAASIVATIVVFLLPETLPAVFSGMVADCLQSDSQKRPTVAAIAARFRQTSSEAEGRNSIPPYDSSRRRPYLLPTAAAGIALAAIVVGTWLVRRSVPSPIPGQTSVQAQPVSKSLPEVDQAEKRANREKEVSPEIAPSPVPPPHAVTPKPSGDSVSGQVTRRVLPNVPQKARDTITGRVTVRVRVSVDPSGRVVSSTLDSAGPSRYFAELALQAARRWEFRPPQVQGHDVSSDWILRFELTRTATEVRPIRVSP